MWLVVTSAQEKSMSPFRTNDPNSKLGATKLYDPKVDGPIPPEAPAVPAPSDPAVKPDAPNAAPAQDESSDKID